MYGPAGHVVTGNLHIVEDKHIRELLRKGPSFREQNNIDWNKIKSILLDAVCAYKTQWAKREYFDVRILNEWQSSLDVNRINVLKRKKQALKKQQVLKRNKHLEYLKQFQQQYVLVPADKASNNNS